MIAQSFEYFAPETLKEALALLERHREDAKVLAGGHSLIPAMKLRLASPRVVVDLGRIPGLDEVRKAGEGLAIGALVTHPALVTSELAALLAPLLPRVPAEVGAVQVRNRGTPVW